MYMSCSAFCGMFPSLDWKTHVQLVVSDMILTNSNIVAPVIIKVVDVSQMMKNDETFQSSLFFTDYFGYRVCLLVAPNGMDECKESTVSVAICILSGPSGGKLSWPRGKFTITLLNQVKNNS